MGFLSSIGAAFLKAKSAVLATTATKVVTAVVATTIVVGGTIGVAQTEVFASPEKKVENALESLFENEESAFGELFGWKEFFKSISKKGVEVESGIQLEDIPLDALGIDGLTLPKIGLDGTFRFDVKKKQMDVNLGAKVADTTLLSAFVYVDEEKAAASVPELLEGYLGANYADSEFVQKLKESELAEMLGEEFTAILETVSDSLETAGDSETSKELEKELLKYLKALKEKKDELFQSMEAEKAGEAKIVVGDETVTCKEYKATFGPEEVETFLSALIDETMTYYNAYIEENAAAYDEAALEEMRASVEEIKEELDAWKEEIKGQIASTTLRIYLNGKRLIMADLCVELKEEVSLNLNALFAPEGNRYDNMDLFLDISGYGETVRLFELTHVTENTEESLSSEWALWIEEEETVRLVSTYEKEEGDFYFGILIPDADVEFALEGVLTIPKKGSEFAFELNDIMISEYGDELHLGFQTDFSVKVLEEKITPPEEITWDVVTMTAEDWEDMISEVTGNLYSLAMKLMFGGY
ncbi:MAG: hypothetical protein E7260_07515 [Lachnospiraceae bacterium]|nr:hypothetical protein [Lachnospiraceae bacterium]